MLTPKQEKFCRQYVVDFNGAQAAIRAGYSVKTAKEQATRLLTNVHVQSFIKTLQTKQNDELEVSANYLTDNIRAVGERCMQAEPVFDKQGNPTGEYRFDSTAALKAWELLGKRTGYFELDNKQKSPETTVNLTGLTFEQLLQLKSKQNEPT